MTFPMLTRAITHWHHPYFINKLTPEMLLPFYQFSNTSTTNVHYQQPAHPVSMENGIKTNILLLLQLLLLLLLLPFSGRTQGKPVPTRVLLCHLFQNRTSED